MAKQESIDDQPQPFATSAAPVSAIDVAVPKMALASGPDPNTDGQAADALSMSISPAEMASVEPGKIDLASIEAPQIVPEADAIKPVAEECAPCGAIADAAPADSTSPRVSRFTLLAASLALAAALGGMAGALASFGLVRPGPAHAFMAGKSNLEEIQTLKENVVQARVELAALKVSIDAGNRSGNAQFTRAGERLDRIDRSHAELAAKLNKAIEALERISGSSGKDVTGSITPAQPIAAPGKPGLLEGWVVRDVHRGTALIEGRMGLIEVDQGDFVPGLGRVESIRKQDGRWVVVTSKGTIPSGR